MRGVVAFANNRGGVGKSTLAYHTAHVVSQTTTVCLLDLTATPTRDGPASPGKSASAALDLLAQTDHVYHVAPAVAALAFIAAAGPTAASICASAAILAAALVYRRLVPPPTLRWEDYGWEAGRNLRIVGSDGTLPSRGFRWQRAAAAFGAPAAVTICDLDNAIDDTARFALTIASHVVIPTTFSESDARRALSDARNGSVFAECERRCARARVLLLFNRCRIHSAAIVGDDEFTLAGPDREARDRVLSLLASHHSTPLQSALFRELPSSLRTQMDHIPLVQITGDAALGAQTNLERILVKLFAEG